jgi:hypothetical protein
MQVARARGLEYTMRYKKENKAADAFSRVEHKPGVQWCSK